MRDALVSRALHRYAELMTTPPATKTSKTSTSKRRRRKQWLHDQPRKPIEVELTGFAAGGKALGHAADGRVVFVEYAIPGEHVIAEITKEDSSYIEATAVSI